MLFEKNDSYQGIALAVPPKGTGFQRLLGAEGLEQKFVGVKS